MRQSESIAKLSEALAKFQEEVTNPANTASNPFYKSKYAPLADVLNLVRPLLGKHGLSLIQNSSGNEQALSVSTLLLHSSGEFIESDTLTVKPEKNTPQGIGSASTYLRRYQASGMLGIASEDDDDGNSQEKDQSKDKNKNEQPKKEQKSDDLLKLIKEINDIATTVKAEKDSISEAIKKHHTSANYNKITDIKIAQLVLDELKKLEVK